MSSAEMAGDGKPCSFCADQEGIGGSSVAADTDGTSFFYLFC